MILKALYIYLVLIYFILLIEMSDGFCKQLIDEYKKS